MMTKLLSNKGMGLLQVLIASSLVGGLGLAIMRMMDMQLKSSRTTDRKFQISQIIEEVTSSIRNPKICTSSLYGKKPGDDIIIKRRDYKTGAEVNLYYPGKRFGILTIQTLKISGLASEIEEIENGITASLELKIGKFTPGGSSSSSSSTSTSSHFISIFDNAYAQDVYGASEKSVKLKLYIDNCPRVVLAGKDAGEVLARCVNMNGLLKGPITPTNITVSHAHPDPSKSGLVSGSVKYSGICQFCQIRAANSPFISCEREL